MTTPAPDTLEREKDKRESARRLSTELLAWIWRERIVGTIAPEVEAQADRLKCALDGYARQPAAYRDTLETEVAAMAAAMSTRERQGI